MGLRLNITAGNDKRVVLWLLNGLHDDGREPFPVELSEDVAVKMVSEVGTRHAVSFVVGDEGRVLLDLKGSDYKIGLWGIEVVGRLNGAKWRAYGDSMIQYTPTTERGAELVTDFGDGDELTLVVGYATDIVPRRTSELVNDGADGEHPFATEEQLEKYAPLNSPTFTGFPIYSDSKQSVEDSFLTSFLASKNWVYRFVEWFKTQTNGIASLVNGKVPTAQIPDLPYIPSNKKGAAGGVAELNAEGKVPTAQAQFALRGNVTAADIDSTALQTGFYRIIGQRLGSDILGGDEANGVLIQYSDGYKEQVLHVGRTAGADAGEQVETYTRRYLPTPKRWTAWHRLDEPAPSNYYTKQQTDDLLSGKASTKDVGEVQQQVAEKLDKIDFDLEFSDEVTDYTLGNYVPRIDTQKWGLESKNKHAYFPVTEGEQYIVKNLETRRLCVYCFLKEYDGSEMAGNIPLVEGTKVYQVSKSNGYEIVTIPEGCTVFVFSYNVYTDGINELKGKVYKYRNRHLNDYVKHTELATVATSGSLTAEVGKYYTLSNVGTLAITLPTIASGTTKVQTVKFYIAAGSSPAVTFTSTHPVYYSDGFGIAADTTYEINALWNGTAWIVTSVTIIVE